MFYLYQLPVPRLTAGNPYFDALVPRAAKLTCTCPEFAALWEQVMGVPYLTPDPSPLRGEGSLTCPSLRSGEGGEERQTLRDEIDAIVAHLYGLSRADLDHIIGTFPLVFPDTPDGQAKKARLLDVYDEWAGITPGWARA